MFLKNEIASETGPTLVQMIPQHFELESAINRDRYTAEHLQLEEPRWVGAKVVYSGDHGYILWFREHKNIRPNSSSAQGAFLSCWYECSLGGWHGGSKTIATSEGYNLESERAYRESDWDSGSDPEKRVALSPLSGRREGLHWRNIKKLGWY